MLTDVVLLLVGLGVLYYGAEWLVTGASKLAFVLGISPLIIGLTVVAFGTSAPELVVSGAASWRGSGDVSLGNIVGSNICNLALVLGAAAVIRPVFVDQGTLRRDYPVMLLASIALFAMALLGPDIGHVDGALLLSGMLVYTGFTIHRARKAMSGRRRTTSDASSSSSSDDDDVGDDVQETLEELEGAPAGVWMNVGLVVAGLACLVVGAELMVTSAVSIAMSFGVSEFVIAVTVVAFGTSLPELATSVVAALKGESDISVGNIIGSNIFNVMWIIGLVGTVFRVPVEARSLTFDFPIMVGVTLLAYPLLRTNFVVGRGKGILLLAVYAAYVVGLFVVR